MPPLTVGVSAVLRSAVPLVRSAGGALRCAPHAAGRGAMLQRASAREVAVRGARCAATSSYGSTPTGSFPSLARGPARIMLHPMLSCICAHITVGFSAPHTTSLSLLSLHASPPFTPRGRPAPAGVPPRPDGQGHRRAAVRLARRAPLRQRGRPQLCLRDPEGNQGQGAPAAQHPSRPLPSFLLLLCSGRPALTLAPRDPAGLSSPPRPAAAAAGAE